MKMLGKIALIGAASAIALPAMACDMHGPNGMFWTPMNHWQNFSPKAGTMDSSFQEDEDLAFLGDISGTFELAPPPPRKVRPSFSSAADRASRAAKTRILMMGNADESEASDAASEDAAMDAEAVASAQAESEADAQPIR